MNLQPLKSDSNAELLLDALDLRLLAQLQRDASLSNQALAEAMGVSPATAHRRVRRLGQLGLIERTVAHLSPQALADAGLPVLQAIVEVTLDVQAEERLAAFEARAVADPSVQQCWRVSPGPDFVLVVAAADMRPTRPSRPGCSPRTPTCATCAASSRCGGRASAASCRCR